MTSSDEGIYLDNIVITETAAGCVISSSGLSSTSCNDNSTPGNPADDYITFQLNPTGSSLSLTYGVAVSGGTSTTITPTTGTFGVATSFSLNTGSAGGGNPTVVITDGADPTCTLNQLITDPGTCAAAPEIQLEQPLTTNRPCGFLYNYGTQIQGSNSDITVRIRNTGTANLTLTLPLAVSGADAAHYSVLAQPTSPIAPGGFSDMIIRFTPASPELKVARIDIVNSDADEATCTINLNGTGAEPEIQLQQPVGVDQACGFTYDFDEHNTSTDTDITVRIRNTGSQDLVFTTPLSISGVDAGQYSIQTQPVSPIAFGGFSDMVIRFSPTTEGEKDAHIDITSDDVDEGTCTINLEGEGIPPCVAPISQPLSLTYPSITANQIDGSFSHPTPIADGYLVVISTLNSMSADPVDATSYSPGDPLGGGTVVQSASSTTFSATGLSPSTTYYFYIFAYSDDDCFGGPAYLMPMPLLGINTTLNGPCIQETFANIGTSGSYGTRIWTGDDGGTWTATDAREDQTINGKAITIRQGTVTTPTYTNGISSITLTTQRVFGSSSQDGTMDVKVNGTSVGSVPYDGTVQTSTIAGIDLPGNVSVVIGPPSHTDARVKIDDIDIFCFDGPEMEITGNSIEIVSGDITPSLTDHTDFGGVETSSGSITRTFTINNIGSQDLDLTDPIPYVTITPNTHYTVSTSPTTPIAASGNVTFEITFDPSANGAHTSTVSIANNDATEDPYTFDIIGDGTNSNLSDVSADGSYIYTSNINYNNYQATSITNSGHSVGVFRFTIRDGGAALTDLDALGTELTDITFDVTNINNIRSAAIFDGNAMVNNAPTINIGAGTIAFSGLSGALVTAADNSSKNLTLRVSFLTAVTDNEQLQFQVSSVDADLSGSVFSSANGGGAISSIVGDRNRIEVAATELIFGQQPSDESINVNMNPSVTVQGVDVNLNLDLDFTDIVSITSSGTMTGDPISLFAINGVATYSGIVHTIDGLGLVLTASHASFTDELSNSFNISTIIYVDGDYRTTGGGNWLSNQASPAIWERLTLGSWVISNSPNYNTSNAVYVRNGHTINSGGSWGSSVNLNIMDSGIFNANHPGTTGSILIFDGGTLSINSSMRNDGTFEVQDNGTVVINRRYGNGSENIPIWWNGTEIFHPDSYLIFNDYDCADDYLIPDNTSISTNSYGGYAAAFGNIIVDFGANLGASDDWKMLDNGVTINMAHGDLVFRSNSSGGADMRVATSGTVTSGIGGDFIVEDGYTNTQNITFKTSGTMNFTIEGNMDLNAATTRLHAGSSGTTTVDVNGNLIITPSSVLNFNSTSAAGPVITLNLEGDVTVAGSGLLQNSNNFSHGIFNFTAIGDGLTDETTQTIDIASTSSNENKYINFYVADDAYVKLINRDFELGQNSAMVAETGGILDFGFNGTTPLNVAISGSQAGSNFSSQSASTLKITSPDGISTTGYIGNVRTVPSGRTYNQTATFHYIGKQNQVTGNGISTGSTGKVIICELLDNSIQLYLTNSTAITSNTTVSATGGKLDIRMGQVIETTTEYISGSTGTLYMSPGTLYRIPKGNASAVASSADLIPRVPGSTYPYVLTGGTIELSGSTVGNYFQTLRGSQFRPDFVHVKFSGTNTLGVDYKHLSSTSVIDSSLIVTDDAIVDCINGAGLPTSFVGDGALVQDNGRIRIRKLNTPNPELSGISTDYSMTGGIVEFYGTSAIESQLIRGTDDRGTPRTLDYFNIEVNADAANTDDYNVNLAAGIIISGTMNINSPAVFQTDNSDHVDGSGDFFVRSGATYKYGDEFGITLGTSTALSAGAIRTSSNRSILNFPTDASYGWVSTGDMTTGNALPATFVNAYLERNLTSDDVTLLHDIEVRETLDMDRGNIIAEDYLITLGSSVAQTGTLDYDITDEPFVVGGMIRWYDAGTNSNYDSGLFPIGVREFGSENIYNRFNLIEYASAKSSGGTLAVAFFEIPMGIDGIPINGIPAVGGCASFNVTTTEQDGYWAIFDGNGIAGGTYDITCTGEGFSTITDICQLTLIKRVNGGNWFESGIHQQPFYLDAPGNIQPTTKRTGASGWSNFGFGGGPDNPLPVELIRFEANKQGRDALLSWTTASEINNDYFEVLHSLDGVDFDVIGAVNGHGTTPDIHYYAQLHDHPPIGLNYYRLRMVDFDGNIEHSEIRTLLFESESGFDLINTMAGDEVQVEITGDNSRSGTLTIYAMNGQVVYRQRHSLNLPVERINVDVAELANAVYVIQWYDGFRPQERKFIKQ